MNTPYQYELFNPLTSGSCRTLLGYPVCLGLPEKHTHTHKRKKIAIRSLFLLLLLLLLFLPVVVNGFLARLLEKQFPDRRHSRRAGRSACVSASVGRRLAGARLQLRVQQQPLGVALLARLDRRGARQRLEEGRGGDDLAKLDGVAAVELVVNRLLLRLLALGLGLLLPDPLLPLLRGKEKEEKREKEEKDWENRNDDDEEDE